MQIQGSVIALLIFIQFSFYSGASALQFYVSKRRPTRNNLQDFQATLPKILQFIYFHPTHNSVYTSRRRGYGEDTTNQIMGISYPMPGFEYLFRTQMSDSAGSLGDLIVNIVFLYALLFISIILGGGVFIPPLVYVILFLIPLRIAFFGVKIKRDPDSYLPD